MTTRDIYRTTFDEDVQPDLNANQCPECGGRVTTNAAETACNDCGLVINGQSMVPDPIWWTCNEDDNERGAPPATHGPVTADE